MENLTKVNFVSFDGYSVCVTPQQVPKKKKPETSYMKGYRVKGYPPGRIQAERKLFEETQIDLESPKEWSLPVWMKNHARKAVRSNPYAIESAALECKRLAIAAGWECMEIVEVKKLIE